MLQASAYSPSHITGFFEILDNSLQESTSGSLGAGVSLLKGVRTEVSLWKSTRPNVSIRINDKPTHQARVSAYVAHKYQGMVGEKYSVHVEHKFDVPIGTGFGTSGAGALSLSLALNAALKLELSNLEASQIAHEAEIASKTGLGTVIAESFGGLEVRLKAGSPGIGRIVEIPTNRGEEVYAVSFGPISTTHVLSTPWMRERINGHAHEFLWNLVDNPSASNLVQLSRKFSDGVGLATPRVKSLLSIFDSLSLPASMLMMGEGVFTILTRDDAKRVAASLMERLPGSAFIVSSSIAPSGARVLDS